jgi:hypothetical protein
MIRVRFPEELGNFLFYTVSRPLLRPTQPSMQWVLGDITMGVKQTCREADLSPSPSAEVKERVELYLHSLIRLLDVVLS